MGEWSNGLFGCFNNIGLCVFTAILPCYTYGKIRESQGDDCLMCGLAALIPCYNWYLFIMTRGKIREDKGIDGSLINDALLTCFCGLCTIVQSSLEVGVVTPLGAGQSVARQ